MRKKVEKIFWMFYIVEMLPLFIIAFFNVPSADDYVNGSMVRDIVTSAGHNLFDWIVQAWNRTIYAWWNSQGTYASYFFSSFIDPLAISDRFYFVGTWCIICCYLIGMYVLCYQVMYKMLGMPKSSMRILYILIMSIIAQCMPSAVEGIYWWSGAFLYTFFLSVALVTLAYFFHMLQKEIWVRKDILNYMCLMILFFILGGSNYPTAIFLVMILGLVLIYIIAFQRKKFVLCISCFGVSVIGLGLNALAPGNSARMMRESVEYVPTIAGTLKICFRLGFQYIRTWFTIPVFVIIILACPIIYEALKNCKIQFKNPLLFSALSLGVFCGLYAPTAYSYGWVGPERYMNVVYAGYVMLVFSNEIYYIGWLRKIIDTAIEVPDAEKKNVEKKMLKKLVKHYPVVVVLCICCLIIVERPNFYTGYSTKSETYTSYTAIRSICSGEARNYYKEFCDRKNVLMNDNIQNVTLAPYNFKPQVLYFDDIVTDETNWKNRAIAYYYGKEIVDLQE